MEMLKQVVELFRYPERETRAIATAAMTRKGLYGGFAAVVYALPGLFLFSGQVIAGMTVVPALLCALLYAGLSVAGVAGFGWLAGRLCPLFGGHGGALAAHKLAVYGLLPFAVGGIFYLIPLEAAYWLAMLAGLYSYYLLYQGLLNIAAVPMTRVVPLLVILSLCALLLFFSIRESVFLVAPGLFAR
jgi:hypothetical protein